MGGFFKNPNLFRLFSKTRVFLGIYFCIPNNTLFLTIGEQAMPTIGTRPVSLTGPTAANFVVVMEGKEGAETGETWWDADKEKFAIMEGDEEPRYYDLLPNGYGSTYEMDGLPELDIMENVTCEERETFVDDNTTVKI